MPQKEAIATIYALARKSMEDPSREREAIRRIAEIVEKEFMDSAAVNIKKIKTMYKKPSARARTRV